MNKPQVNAGQIWCLGDWLFLVVRMRYKPDTWWIYFFNPPHGTTHMQQTSESYMQNNPQFQFIG